MIVVFEMPDGSTQERELDQVPAVGERIAFTDRFDADTPFWYVTNVLWMLPVMRSSYRARVRISK